VLYRDNSFGFSFELPDAWRHDRNYLQPTFRRHDWVGQIIVDVAKCTPEYLDPEDRAANLGLPGASVSRTDVGGEVNAIVFQNAHDSSISVVHDDIHYTINYLNDPASQSAIELLKKSWRFPNIAEADKAIKTSSRPEARTLARVLQAGLADDARGAKRIRLPRSACKWWHSARSAPHCRRSRIGRTATPLVAVLEALVGRSN
jgi:hypothetical protein